MGTPVPYPFVTGLPRVAQEELERDFLHLTQQITNGVTLFDAIIDSESPVNAGAHVYPNLGTLVANEGLSATRLFVIGVVTRLSTTIVETGAITLAGPVALIAGGWGAIGAPTNTPGNTQNRQRWNLAGFTVSTNSVGWLTIVNMQIESSATPTASLPFPLTNVYLHGCNVVGQDPTVSATPRFSQIAGGKLYAVATSFVDSQASGDRSYLIGCTYNFHNNAGTAWQPGVHGDYYFIGGYISQSNATGGITVATNTSLVYIDAEMSVFAANQQGTGTMPISITSTNDTFINLRGTSLTWLTDLTMGAGAGNCHVEGNVFHSVLISGNTNKKERYFHGTIAPSGASPTGLDVTGPATVRATMLSASNAAGVAVVRGSAVKLDLHIRASANPALALVGATDCQVTIDLAPPAGVGSQAYTIDSGSARNIVMVSGSKNSNFTVASTNSSSTTNVIDEGGPSIVSGTGVGTDFNQVFMFGVPT